MPILEQLQQLTPAQSALLYNLVDLGYLTRAQVDQLINRLVNERFANNQAHIISRAYYAMSQIDYYALREAISEAFTSQYGSQIIKNVDLVHFNPDLIEVTVEVQKQQPEMKSYAFSLSEELHQQGLQVGIHILS